jgi:hypothetical protein
MIRKLRRERVETVTLSRDSRFLSAIFHRIIATVGQKSRGQEKRHRTRWVKRLSWDESPKSDPPNRTLDENPTSFC